MTSRLGRSPLFRALSPATLRALLDRSVARSFSKGELLLRAGERAEWFHVLEEGLVREYYVTSEGVEHTRVFVAEGGVTGSLLDLTSGQPSVTWIQALEPTRTTAIRMTDLDALTPTHPELVALARRHAEALAVRKTKREYEMLALSAEERLARWHEEHPGLDRRVTRRLLASYLGMTPVHLSRISGAGGKASTSGPSGKGPRRR
jgi:CRP-like cAMP-binding protein